MMKDDFLYAIQQCEVKKYLRGDAQYRKYSKSVFYIAYEPTETTAVVKEIFGSEKDINGGVDIFLDTLHEMMRESAVNAYLVFDYLDALTYENNKGGIDIKPYRKKIEMLKIQLIEYIRLFQEELKGEIVFPNGWSQKNAWGDIQNRCDNSLKKYSWCSFG